MSVEQEQSMASVAVTAPFRWYRTSLGKKGVMAVTGIIMVLFVVGHIFGNLKLFEGASVLDTYAGFLRTVGAPVFLNSQLLWLIRLVLLAAVGLHIVAAVQLTQQNHAARPTRYARKSDLNATVASRTMRWGGTFVGLFIVYHILNLTTGTIHPGYVEGQVYQNVVRDFQTWWIALIYIAAMLALGLHLYHGTWSVFQTFGLRSQGNTRAIRIGAGILTGLFLVASISLPLAVLVGFVK